MVTSSVILTSHLEWACPGGGFVRAMPNRAHIRSSRLDGIIAFQSFLRKHCKGCFSCTRYHARVVLRYCWLVAVSLSQDRLLHQLYPKHVSSRLSAWVGRGFTSNVCLYDLPLKVKETLASMYVEIFALNLRVLWR
jgi:hypothetical protein